MRRRFTTFDRAREAGACRRFNKAAIQFGIQAWKYLITSSPAPAPAGCVLANRLSEDPNKRVLLIESGPKDDHPLIHMPKGVAKLRTDQRYMWSVRHLPEFEPAGTRAAMDAGANAWRQLRDQRNDLYARPAQGLRRHGRPDQRGLELGPHECGLQCGREPQSRVVANARRQGPAEGDDLSGRWRRRNADEGGDRLGAKRSASNIRWTSTSPINGRRSATRCARSSRAAARAPPSPF